MVLTQLSPGRALASEHEPPWPVLRRKDGDGAAAQTEISICGRPLGSAPDQCRDLPPCKKSLGLSDSRWSRYGPANRMGTEPGPQQAGMSYNLVTVGNPNSGKTSLFNA